MNIFSTSYKTDESINFLTSFVSLVKPTTVVEIGCQQGRSTIALAKGLSSEAKMFTFDLFEKKYSSPPYGETFANEEIVKHNLIDAQLDQIVSVFQGDHLKALEIIPSTIDMLHVDICNHYDNLRPVLYDILSRIEIKKAILLEGGIFNQWQQKCGFKSYSSLLREQFIALRWNYITIPFASCSVHNAITICTPR